jgi:hypothetical protein
MDLACRAVFLFQQSRISCCSLRHSLGGTIIAAQRFNMHAVPARNLPELFGVPKSLQIRDTFKKPLKSYSGRRSACILPASRLYGHVDHF